MRFQINVRSAETVEFVNVSENFSSFKGNIEATLVINKLLIFVSVRLTKQSYLYYLNTLFINNQTIFYQELLQLVNTLCYHQFIFTRNIKLVIIFVTKFSLALVSLLVYF